jgi:hypothetical protein
VKRFLAAQFRTTFAKSYAMPITIAASAGGRLHGVSHRLCVGLASLLGSTPGAAKRRDVMRALLIILFDVFTGLKKASASI